MNWGSRVSWAVLAGLVAVSGIFLTRLITHVERGPRPHVGIEYDEQPPFVFNVLQPNLYALKTERFRVPRVVMVDLGTVLFVITPATRSIALTGIDPHAISCGYFNGVRQGQSAAEWVDDVQGQILRPAAVNAESRDKALITVPLPLREILARAPAGQGAIRCSFEHPIAAATTFTDRTLTVRVKNGTKGSVIIDISALDDIGTLRFSGGLEVPFAGERSRLLENQDKLLSAEWSDVTAEEQRDIILVVIGALAAIGAAMAIEAIRPIIERETKK